MPWTANRRTAARQCLDQDHGLRRAQRYDPPLTGIASRRPARSSISRGGACAMFLSWITGVLSRLPGDPDRAADHRLVRRAVAQHAAADRRHRALVRRSRRPTPASAARSWRACRSPPSPAPPVSRSACRSATRCSARKAVAVRAFARVLYQLPVALPPLVLAFGFILVFSSDTLPWLGSIWLLAAGHVVLGLPYFLQTVVADMQRLGLRTLEDAAESLGSNGLQRFMHIVVPALRHSILAGLIIVAALSIGEFQFSNLVAGFLNRTYPVVLLQAFYGATGFACAATVILLSLAFLAAVSGSLVAGGATRMKVNVSMTTPGGFAVRRHVPLPRLECGRVRHHARHHAGRADRVHRSERLRQDDAAAPDRRLSEARCGHDPPRRRRRQRVAAARTRMRRRVPGVRAVPAHARVGERRVSAARARRSPCGTPPARGGDAEDGRPHRAARPAAGAAFGRPAAARRARRARWCSSRARCCSTSRCPRSTPRRAWRCATRYGASSADRTSRRC